MSLSVTLADANILFSRTLRDYFVYAAKLGALDIHWSDGNLNETTRNLIARVEMDAKDRHVLAAALSAKAELLLTQNTRHLPREWMAKRGIELIDAGTLLTQLAADYPDILREAHRLGVNSRPQPEEQIFKILVDQIGAEATAVVRAVVTAEPATQTEPESAD